MIQFLFIFLIAYLIGSIPFGLILVRLAGKGDIRKIGSGNIGATNVLRTGSKKLAALTLLLDGGKGYFAIMMALVMVLAIGLDEDLSFASGKNFPLYIELVVNKVYLVATFGVLLGHLFPVWLKFKGGKGVATALGIYFAIDWRLGVVACITWLITAIIFRYSSLAALIAIVATLLTPLIDYFLNKNQIQPSHLRGLHDSSLFWITLVIAILVIARHHANIRRLLSGTEPKIGQSKTETTNATP